jgi:hypothetical protein
LLQDMLETFDFHQICLIRLAFERIRADRGLAKAKSSPPSPGMPTARAARRRGADAPRPARYQAARNATWGKSTGTWKAMLM